MVTSTPTTSTTRTAEHRRLGVFAVAFMIIAASAPLTVLAGGVTSAYAVTHVDGIPSATSCSRWHSASSRSATPP